MKRHGFAYEVKAKVSFSEADAKALQRLARHHYSEDVQSLAYEAGRKVPTRTGYYIESVNGFFTMILHRFEARRVAGNYPEEDLIEEVPFRTIDTIAKLCEMGMYARLASESDTVLLTTLGLECHRALDSINKEYQRLVGGEDTRRERLKTARDRKGRENLWSCEKCGIVGRMNHRYMSLRKDLKDDQDVGDCNPDVVKRWNTREST